MWLLSFPNLSYREKSNYVGAIFQGKMCNIQYGGGIALVRMVQFAWLRFINRMLFRSYTANIFLFQSILKFA